MNKTTDTHFLFPGASLAMATNWICNYAVVQATLPGIENLGYKFWIIWVRPVCTPHFPSGTPNLRQKIPTSLVI